MQLYFSGSNDNNTKFWARNRPGDTQDDIYGLASFSGSVQTPAKETKTETAEEKTFITVIPGLLNLFLKSSQASIFIHCMLFSRYGPG